ncbi:sensor histidine kinase [Kutzneria sp. CA-103260]|uniref:sensor histidine kinase n=1 Tax=Kutzneria sp. CA-103260 TaxID=2802641 RepID=UPI001BAD0535|nr:sensor histidine kinase [Kutzneria sp. CA-103260]
MGSSMMTRLRIVPLALGLALASQLGYLPLVLVVVSASLIPLGIGVPAVIGSVAMCRWFADLHRGVAGSLLGRDVPRPYRPIQREDKWLARFRIAGGDPATWRDLCWLVANTVVGLVTNLLVVVLLLGGLFYVTMPVWWPSLPPGSDVGNIGLFRVRTEGDTLWMVLLGVGVWIFWLWITPRLMWLNAMVTASLLGPTETEVVNAKLTTRVTQLSESRAVSVDTHAAELRRIERDLHDGAQARLVALGMSLGMAEETVDDNPEAAKQLLSEAREATTSALAELRSLVRGIHPPVLADRGLEGALQALALASPANVKVAIDVPGRPPEPVESAVYFAIAEALTNTAKYSGAENVWLRLSYSDGKLVAVVGDDGRGGASVEPGGGLHGLERRLAAFDGTLLVTSPLGGPTVVFLEVPCTLTPA